MPRIAELACRAGAAARILLIYIAEAHSYDEWPDGDHLVLGRRIYQPKRVEERLQLAREFVRDFGLEDLELLVDDPAQDDGGGFDATYAAWPTRFYVVQGGRVTWLAHPDEDHTYDSALDELELLAKSLAPATVA